MKKCSKCAKAATLHITEIRKGVVQEVHLCESCAQQYLSATTPSDDEEIELEEEAGNEAERELSDIDQLVCPSCGISFREFRSQGRLGCPHDYIAFEKELLPLLENIHGATQHTGKFPKRAPDASQRQYQLIKLRSELKQAIEEEAYEQAARLRDQIQQIEKSSDEG
jgi:protein arginine kinase activator